MVICENENFQQLFQVFLRNLISNTNVKMNRQAVKWSGVIHART